MIVAIELVFTFIAFTVWIVLAIWALAMMIQTERTRKQDRERSYDRLAK